LRKHPWNERHKISGEHLDHVLRLKTAGVQVAYTPQCVLGEIKSASPEYAEFRRRGVLPDSDWGIKKRTGDHHIRPERGIARKNSAVPVLDLNQAYSLRLAI
jgi:hypothetical protein